MTPTTRRTNLPEPLSGLPEAAVVELGHQRPWLTLEETNRLLRQHEQLAPSMARAWVLDELLAAVPLTPERQQPLVQVCPIPSFDTLHVLNSSPLTHYRSLFSPVMTYYSYPFLTIL